MYSRYSLTGIGLTSWFENMRPMVKTEQTVTAKTAMLLQFWRGKVNVFFKLSLFNVNLDVVFTTLSRITSAAETLLSRVSYQFAAGSWLAKMVDLFAYSGRYPFTYSGDIRSVRWWSSVSFAFYLYYPKGYSVSSQLTWTHWRALLRVQNEVACEYYIQECAAAKGEHFLVFPNYAWYLSKNS